jgi:hypothetical protein
MPGTCGAVGDIQWTLCLVSSLRTGIMPRLIQQIGARILGLLWVMFWLGASSVNSVASFSAYPRELVLDPQRYVLQAGYYAIHAPANSTRPALAGAIAHLSSDDGAIALFTGEPSSQPMAAGEVVSPVYALEPAGGLAVPTGLVFVRLHEAQLATNWAPQFQAAGYAIAYSPPYAPQTVWLKAQSGNWAEALSGLARLAQIPGVVAVEPQLLEAAARKSGG